MKFPHAADLPEGRTPYVRRSFVEEIETQVELAGTPRTSSLFPLKVVAAKVQACLERQQLPACAECPHSGNCELAATHATNLASLPQLRAEEAAKPKADNVWLNLNVDSLPADASS